MGFKIVKENEKAKIISNGYYELGELKREGYIAYRINKVSDMDYLPTIYINTDDEEKIIGFEIETSGHGALSTEKIKEIINCYNIAIDTVTELEKIYL